jgi:hypothetical protein
VLCSALGGRPGEEPCGCGSRGYLAAEPCGSRSTSVTRCSTSSGAWSKSMPQTPLIWAQPGCAAARRRLSNASAKYAGHAGPPAAHGAALAWSPEAEEAAGRHATRPGCGHPCCGCTARRRRPNSSEPSDLHD